MEDRYKLQDSVLITLGTMTVNFSALEEIFSNVAAPLLRSGRVSIIVATQLSFSRMLTLISSLAKDQLDDGALRTELLDSLKDCAVVEERRNKVVHSWWIFETTGTVSRMKSIATRKRGLRTELEQVDLQELIRTTDEIGMCLDRMLNLAVRLQEHIKGRPL